MGELLISEHVPIRLGPITTVRVTNLIGALVIAAAGTVGVWGGFFVGVAHNGIILTALGAPFAVYGLLMAPLSLRLRLELFEDRAVVRGYFTTQTIPRRRITAVTPWPSVIWTDARGRVRRTWVNALNVYRTPLWAWPNPVLVANVDARIEVLRAWAS